MFNAEFIRQEIEKVSGVPASLLTGETLEENIAQAKAMLAYKKGKDGAGGGSDPGALDALHIDLLVKDPDKTLTRKSPAEQFADWLNKSGGRS